MSATTTRTMEDQVNKAANHNSDHQGAQLEGLNVSDENAAQGTRGLVKEQNVPDPDKREMMGNNRNESGSSVDVDKILNGQTDASEKEDFMDNELLDFDSDPETMDPEVRIKLFTLGQQLQKDGNNIHALKCFLRCLSGLNGKRNFPHMSECLRKVAEIYYSIEEYEKAVQFIQAEKVYYESELMDSTESQQELGSQSSDDDSDAENITSTGDGECTDAEYNSTDVIRAQEYDGLAQLCQDHNQPEMALEYQAKATKLRRRLLGLEHPVTRKSLDKFTVMYGEAGKYQYSESMKRMSETEGVDEDPGTESSNIRQRRRPVQGYPGDGVQVDDTQRNEYSQDIQHIDETDTVIQKLLMLMFIVCLVALVIAGSYIYCRITTQTQTCQRWTNFIEQCYWKLMYWISSPTY